MPAQKFRNPVTAARGLKVDEVFKANADLSTCQYRFVALGTVEGEVIGATGASNPAPIGVLQNAPTASQKAIVRLFGRTQLTVPATACTLTRGYYVSSTGCGGGAYTGASGMIFGRVISGSVASATAGSLIVMLNTITPSGSLNAGS
jgi:hypothetical protein